MAHLPLYAEKNKVFINEMPFKVERMSSSIINIYSRKVNQGDPGPDDHPINSTWIQRDWGGGGQVLQARPDISNNRFYWSTMETMYSNAMTLAPLPTIYDDPSGATNRTSIVLGTFADQVMASWDNGLYAFNHGTSVWDLEGTLNAPAIAKATSYTYSTGALIGTTGYFIPQGSTSDVWNGSSVTAVGKSAVSFVVWDDKLFRLGTNGALEYTTDGSSWSGGTYIPDGSTPMSLIIYMNLGGDPAVHIVTSQAVWAYDFTTGKLYQTQMQYPKHPDQGRAASVWRAEMQVGVGDGIHRYNRSTIAAMGLDRDDGLPVDYRGVIVDLEPSYNALYALVSGATLDSTSQVDAYTLELGGGDDQMYGAVSTVTSLLMRWNGVGWHFVDRMTGYAPTTCHVSDSSDNYAVWYAADRKVRRIDLPRSYFNPKDDVSFPVQTEGTTETMWYNFGWEGQPKIAKRFEIFVDRASATETVQIQYKIDEESNDWVTIGVIDSPGEHSFYLGRDPEAASETEDPLNFHGFVFERIKFQYYAQRGDDVYARPVIRWTDLIVRRYLRPNRSWRMSLDLTAKNNDYTPTEMADHLISAAIGTSTSTFTHQNSSHRVELVALEFQDSVGSTGIQTKATVNLIESNELDSVGVVP